MKFTPNLEFRVIVKRRLHCKSATLVLITTLATFVKFIELFWQKRFYHEAIVPEELVLLNHNCCMFVCCPLLGKAELER